MFLYYTQKNYLCLSKRDKSLNISQTHSFICTLTNYVRHFLLKKNYVYYFQNLVIKY